MKYGDPVTLVPEHEPTASDDDEGGCVPDVLNVGFQREPKWDLLGAK